MGTASYFGRSGVLSVVACAVGLAAVGVLPPAAAVADNADRQSEMAPLTGTWALLDAGTTAELPEADVGVLTFDGTSRCSGEVTTMGWQGVRHRGLSACSYDLDAGGRGRLTGRLDDGSDFGVAFTYSSSERRVSYVSTDRLSAKVGSMSPQAGAGTARPESTIAGRWTWSMRAEVGTVDVAFSGLFTFDGRSGCSIVLDEANAVEGYHRHRSVSGRYSVRPDGIGTITSTLDDGVDETRYFVASDSGRRIGFVLSASLPTVVGAGEMQRR